MLQAVGSAVLLSKCVHVAGKAYRLDELAVLYHRALA